MKIKPIVFCFICLNLVVPSTFGLGIPAGSSEKSDVKFLLGLRGGINFSDPLVLNSYSIFSNTSASVSPNFKKYGKWYKNTGSQYGIVAMMQFKERTYVSLQPSISTHNFKYTGTYSWLNPQNVSESATLIYHHVQSLKYAEFPLLIRQDLTSSRLRPYVQAGGFYSFLQTGMQNISLTEEITSNQAPNQIPEGTRSGSVSDQFISTHLGLIAGGGVAYKLEWVMLGLDVQYKRGLHNITNKANRYSNQSLLGDTFDVPDDISINAWMISVNVVFSLGFNKPAKGALKCP